MQLKPGMPADAVIETGRGERGEGRGKNDDSKLPCGFQKSSCIVAVSCLQETPRRVSSVLPSPLSPLPSPMDAIRTHQLTKRFGDLTAVDGLTLAVAEGEIFGLVGPDGAGKNHYHAALERHHGSHQRRGPGSPDTPSPTRNESKNRSAT